MEGFVVGIHASKCLNTARRNPLQRHTRSQATDRSSDRSELMNSDRSHLGGTDTLDSAPQARGFLASSATRTPGLPERPKRSTEIVLRRGPVERHARGVLSSSTAR